MTDGRYAAGMYASLKRENRFFSKAHGVYEYPECKHETVDKYGYCKECGEYNRELDTEREIEEPS